MLFSPTWFIMHWAEIMTCSFYFSSSYRNRLCRMGFPSIFIDRWFWGINEDKTAMVCKVFQVAKLLLTGFATFPSIFHLSLILRSSSASLSLWVYHPEKFIHLNQDCNHSYRIQRNVGSHSHSFSSWLRPSWPCI